MTLREKLIVLRDKAGITQMALAHQLGVSRQAVTRWESGDTAPSMEKLKALAKIYDVSLDWLCNDATYGVEQQKPASAVSADEICDANISSTKKKGIQINRRSTIALAICIGVIVLAYPVVQCCVVLLTEKIRAEALLPGQLELPVVIGTVSQIEVDQSLIGDAFCVGQRLEVVDGAAVDVDGDLLFQPVRVWIFSWIQFADVIFISHTITSNSIKINALLGFGCLPCRDNTDAVFVVTVAMAHNANFLRFDRSDNEEAIFFNGMIRIVK